MLKWQLDIGDVKEEHFGTWSVELYSAGQRREASPILTFNLVIMPPCTLQLDTATVGRLAATALIDEHALTEPNWLTTSLIPTDLKNGHPSLSDSFCASLIEVNTIEDI